MARSRKMVKSRKSSAKKRRSSRTKRSSLRLSSVSRKRMMLGGGDPIPQSVPEYSETSGYSSEGLQKAIDELSESLKKSLVNCKQPDTLATQPPTGGFGFSHLNELMSQKKIITPRS